MIISAIAKRYAKAFVDVAADKDRLEEFAAELKILAAFYKDSADFRHVLKHPAFQDEERKSVVNALASKIGLSAEIANLLKTLIENKRTGELVQVSAAVAMEVDKRLGRARATVSSAVPLPLMALKKLQQTLEGKFGKKIEVTQDVNPKFIGGVVTQIGNTVIDGTIVSRLRAIRKKLATG